MKAEEEEDIHSLWKDEVREELSVLGTSNWSQTSKRRNEMLAVLNSNVMT